MDYFWNTWEFFRWFGKPPLREPWRNVPWDDRRQILREVKNYRPRSEAQHLRILLHGPPGSGKSSFINSVDSALRGKTSTRALPATAYRGSFTKEYKSYKIEKDRAGSHYPFVFSDTMGIEKGSGRGAEVDEINLILKGHIREGFKFSEKKFSPRTSPYYNETPTINDKVHVLVCVVPADKLDVMDYRSFEKIKDVRDAASDLGIPQVAILTQIDEPRDVVQYGLKYVYRSKQLKRQMEKVRVMTGIPMNCIFPVKNYSEEIETDEETDTLILSTMKKIIDFGEDFLNDQSSSGDDRTDEIALNHNMEHS